MNLFLGSLIQRFGTKKLICTGFFCLIGSAVIKAAATQLWAFYAAGILMGIGLSWTGTAMISTVLNKWCKENKATITGAALAANGIGGAVAVQIISPIIFEEGNPFGYRNSYYLISIILAVVLVLLLIFYRNPPAEENAEPAKPGKKKPRGAGWEGMEYEEVIRKPYFYIALVCMFLIGMVLQGLGGIGVPHMYDIGLDVDFVAFLTSVGGVALTCTKFLTGFLYDRFGIKFSMNLALICAFLSMLILVFMKNTPVWHFLAFLRQFIGSIATPLQTIMLPIFAVEFFGNKAFDRLIGFFTAASSAGFAIGSPFGNVCYDIFGDYRPAFMVFALLMAVSAISLQFVLRSAHRDRKRILEAQNAESPA